MRVIIAILCVLLARAAHADTIWSVKLGDTQLRTIAVSPNDLLPACRCVAGTFKLGKDTATHFTGTMSALSFNHARKPIPKTLGVKIRKTRPVMGVHRDHRPVLHGILNGSGTLVLREVTGGEWEVVGFADGPVGDLFAENPQWRAKRTPKVAKATPLVDNAADATELADIINDYRASIDLPRVPISPKLTKVAQAHVHDLNVNKPVTDRCNMHSWSKQSGWSGCCYDGSKAAAKCMWVKPKEIAGFKANGYEIAANASGIGPQQALELWQKSPAHHAVMINQNQWNKPWRSLGVAVEGDFAVAWFAEEADK